MKIIIPQPPQRHGQPRHHKRGLLQVRVAKGPVCLECGPGAEKDETEKQMLLIHDEMEEVGQEDEAFAVICFYSQVVCMGLMWWFGIGD